MTNVQQISFVKFDIYRSSCRETRSVRLIVLYF